ncbi:MAG: CoA-binding protein [Thermovirgaceae bacterium]|nr:CoA-binding protein [Thermovirgaceae bacterium]
MTMEEIIDKFVCKPSRVVVAGASTKPDRPVYGVMEYLGENGFTLFPVNPACAGEAIQGLACVGSVLDLKEEFDILALFISPKRQQPVLDEILRLSHKPVVWMQPGAENDEAEVLLKGKGYEVVKGACLMMIHQVYCGE